MKSDDITGLITVIHTHIKCEFSLEKTKIFHIHLRDFMGLQAITQEIWLSFSFNEQLK